MTKKNILLIASLLLLFNNCLFCQMAELPLSQKLQQASDIFEGKVIDKTCFWNTQHSLIFTSNTVEIYKVFKGNLSLSKVEIITEGGQIENEIQGSQSTLQLNDGNIGIFLAEPSNIHNSQISENKISSFKVYGSSQGFIKYDLSTNSATDPFKKYTSIQNDVYKAIEEFTGHPYKEIKAFSSLQVNETSSSKKKCSFRMCKKKNKK